MRNYSYFRGARKGAFLALIALLLCSVPEGLNAQESATRSSNSILELDKSSINYPLRQYLNILPDSAGALSIAEVSQSAFAADFQPYRDYRHNLKTHYWYWGQVQLKNSLPAAEQHLEWVLYFPSRWTKLEVYTQDESGAWTMHQAGASVAFRDRQFAPTARGSFAKLSLQPGSPTTLYFRGRAEAASLAPSFGIYLQTLDRFHTQLAKSRVSNALYIGFMGMLCIYNLIFYLFGRDRSFIYYSGYIFMAIVYFTQTSGELAHLLQIEILASNPAQYSIFKGSMFLGLIFYLAFIMHFCDLQKLLPQWNKYFIILIYLGIILFSVHLGVSVLSNYSHIHEDTISVPYIALVLGSCIALLYPLYRTGDTKARFIIAGIVALGIGGFLTMLTRLAFPPYQTFYLKAGVLVEVLIFSVGLAYRQWAQVQAKERAVFELRESRMIQAQQELEADRLREDNRKNALLAERSRDNEILLKEIHHRVKNNLEVVSSLLELQSLTLTDGTARDAMLASRGRVESIGLLHQKLYQGNNLGTVAMREYLTDLTRNLSNSFGVTDKVSFIINVPQALHFDVDTAVPLGLIANELITNSIKYAFGSLKAGTVEVEMRQHRERYCLAIYDNGRGKTAEPTAGTGFGNHLVSMLVHQLEGELRESFSDGVRIEIFFDNME